ncbi:hypothetical protein TorRG33x02_170010, partial [Trema orientale]
VCIVWFREILGSVEFPDLRFHRSCAGQAFANKMDNGELTGKSGPLDNQPRIA